MNINLLIILVMMMDGGPTVMGIANSTAAFLGASMFITSASAATVAYLMKRRNRKNQS